MSPKLMIGLFSIAGFVLGIGGSYGWEVVSEISKPDDVKRSLASLPMGKHNAAIFVRIETPTEIPENNYTEIEVKAYITKRISSLGDIAYTWKLPDGVVASESLSGIISSANTGGPEVIVLHVRGFSKVEKLILSLDARARLPDGQILGSSGMISSRPEDSMEYIAPIMAEVAPDGPTLEKKQE